MWKRKRLRCSFCRKTEAEVAKLVAGPGVYICDECVALAQQIMESDLGPGDFPKPAASVWRKLIRRAGELLHGRNARCDDFTVVGQETS